MPSIDRQDVEEYAQRHLCLSELPSAQRCEDAGCIITKLSIHRELRGTNNYQSFLLSQYLNEMATLVASPDRETTTGFAFFKFVRSHNQWYAAVSEGGTASGRGTRCLLVEVWIQFDDTRPEGCRADFHTMLVLQGPGAVVVIPFDPIGADMIQGFLLHKIFGEGMAVDILSGQSPYVSLLWFHVACVTNSDIVASLRRESPGPAGSYLFELHLVDALVPRNVDTQSFRLYLDRVYHGERARMVREMLSAYQPLGGPTQHRLGGQSLR